MHNPSSPESAHPTESLNTGVHLACSETHVRSELTILPDCCQWCRRRGWCLSMLSRILWLYSRVGIYYYLSLLLFRNIWIWFRIKTTVLHPDNRRSAVYYNITRGNDDHSSNPPIARMPSTTLLYSRRSSFTSDRRRSSAAASKNR
jgi:hypothetical protein